MTLRFGLLGAGRIGKVHARANPDARLAAVAAALPDAALAAECRAETWSIQAIEAAEDIDAVVICTPNDTHANLIERFATTGKGIFCEKPVDLSLARVRDCLRVVEETGATLMVGFNRRFDPDFNALKAAIDDGRIGAVEMVTLTSRDPGPPPYDYIERSGGIFRDMTRWLLGEEVETVLAAASVLVDPDRRRLHRHHRSAARRPRRLGSDARV
jgi:myo-inositol 2-dehydrogenase / D-chiro-inositol 1-dehydrogenase